jgi:hypothetical protein
MPVVFDSTNSGAGSRGFIFGGAVTASYTHTVASGADRVAIVLGKYHDSSNTASGSITITATFGGQAMTALGSLMNNNTTGDKTTLLYLLNPPTGSQTVTVSCTSPQVNRGCIAVGMTFRGVKNLGPLATSFGSGTTSSITYAGYANGLAVTALSYTSPGASLTGYTAGTVAFRSQSEAVRTSVLTAAPANGNYTQGAVSASSTPWGILGVALIGDSPFFTMF